MKEKIYRLFHFIDYRISKHTNLYISPRPATPELKAGFQLASPSYYEAGIPFVRLVVIGRALHYSSSPSDKFDDRKEFV
ncbi:MAG: hypothetical protein LBR10_09435 [Prevotellaceae bacterium]|nr:hypothetical protein [Prevotellaceae bacterium]